MTRRTLWTTLGLVLGLFVVASLAPRHGPTVLAWWRTLRLEPLLAAMPRLSMTVSPTTGMIGGGIAGVVIFVLLLRARARSTDPAPEVIPPFATQLADAMRATVPHGGARRREAEELVRAGVATEEIARTTRLSRDAIRVIGAAIAAAERHDLPPRDVASVSP
jgi:hypothetical protein